MVTYIIRERGGGHSAGYVSSGFFGGITMGRVVLIYLNKKVGTILYLHCIHSHTHLSKIGEYRVTFIYAFVSLGYIPLFLFPLTTLKSSEG